MAASIEPNSGLFYGWALGENGWNTGMDANLLSIGRFAYHLSVKDRDLAAPPVSPVAGDTYIVGPAATGLWAGKENQVAAWDGVSWVFGIPRVGWSAYLEDETTRAIYNGSAWAIESGGGSYTDEQVLDVVGTALVAGAGIDITIDDAANTITLESTAGGSTTTDKAFVYLNTATNSHSGGTWGKVPLDTVLFDSGSIWNATDKRLMPTQAGYYHVDLRVRRSSASTLAVGMYKNGVLQQALGPDASLIATGGSVIVYCDGVADYIECFCYSTSALAYTIGTVDTFMSIHGPL
jgi:hypothetical protein